jgi:Polysaccharide biosynthesis enzyme WcbI
MKIHVVGPCQTIPIAACLALMNPDVRVERLAANADLGALGPDDVVLRQRDRPLEMIGKQRHNEIVYPGVWFNAFHPDVVYLIGPWGAVPPPLGSDHSSLVLYAWHRGMSAAQTAKLFSEPVFEALRFLDCWDESKRALLDEGRSLGFPFEAMFARLERYGCFMHSPIHPALVVMAELARELARRAGLTAVVPAPEQYLDDPMLRGVVWPFYP